MCYSENKIEISWKKLEHCRIKKNILWQLLWVSREKSSKKIPYCKKDAFFLLKKDTCLKNIFSKNYFQILGIKPPMNRDNIQIHSHFIPDFYSNTMNLKHRNFLESVIFSPRKSICFSPFSILCFL